MLSASNGQCAVRARTSPFGGGLLSSPSFTRSPSVPPQCPPSTPLPNHPKITAAQQYDCAHVSMLSASNGQCAVRARTSPFGGGLLSSPCSTCSPFVPPPCPLSTPHPNQSNMHGAVSSVQSNSRNTSAPFSAPFSTVMAALVPGGPRAGVPVAAAVCVTLSPLRRSIRPLEPIRSLSPPLQLCCNLQLCMVNLSPCRGGRALRLLLHYLPPPVGGLRVLVARALHPLVVRWSCLPLLPLPLRHRERHWCRLCPL